MSSQISSTSPTPATDRRMRAVLAVAVATQTAGSFVSQGIYILVPFWREAFGISLASASLAVTVMNGVQIVTMFTLGRAIDIHGERRIVGIAMLGMALAMACAASFANSLPALLLCIAFLGGTYAAVQPGGTRAIMRWFPPAKRGIATGFRQAAVPFGTMIAAALLPFMAVRYGWHAAAWLCAGISVMGAALFCGLYREGGDVAAKPSARFPWQNSPARSAESELLARITAWYRYVRVSIHPHRTRHRLHGGWIGAWPLCRIVHVCRNAACGHSWPDFAAMAQRPLPARPSHAILRPGIRYCRRRCRNSRGSTHRCPGTCHPRRACRAGNIRDRLVSTLSSADRRKRTERFDSVDDCLRFHDLPGVMAIGPYIFGLLVDHLGYGAAWFALIVPVVATALPLTISSPRLPKVQIGSS